MNHSDLFAQGWGEGLFAAGATLAFVSSCAVGLSVVVMIVTGVSALFAKPERKVKP